MPVEIDQSGKIENTNRHTVIGLANQVKRSLLITAKDKRKLQTTFRSINQPRIFISRVFAAAIVYLLNDVKIAGTITIDTEYPGHENYILRSIEELAAKINLPIEKHQIEFREIGKRSPAHAVAYTAYKTKRADRVLSAREILQLLLK